MSQENVQLVQAFHPRSGTDLKEWFGEEASSRIAAAEDLFQPDCEIESDGGVLGVVSGSGLTGLTASWRRWLEPWDEYWTEVELFIDAGDRVLVLLHDHGRLRGSAQEVVNTGGSVWSIRDGKVARIAFYNDRQAALEAAGLQD
jgi:ketosteroid isomerase-like protein